MALLKCPECKHDVSDKATACSHCGYPMNSPTSTKPRIRNGKPTKLPNGYGTIYKLPGKRTKPFRAVKTDKWVLDAATGKSKQIRFTIGYYATREEAMIALAEYNENPYDIKADSITFSEVYEKWNEGYFPTLSNPSSIRTITAAYAYCNGLYNMRMKDIRVSHLEGTILNADIGDSTKGRIKSLFNMMYKYAVAHDIVDKDYASVMFANGNPIKRERTKEPMLEIRAEREDRKSKEAEPEPEQTAEEKQAGEYRCHIARMIYDIESLDTIASIYSFIIGLLSVKKGGAE